MELFFRVSKFIARGLVSSLFVAFICSSCKKRGPTNATIYVKDSAGVTPIGGVAVTRWQDTSFSTQTGQQATIRVTRITDPSGRAEFEFSLEAYLHILAIKNGDSTNIPT